MVFYGLVMVLEHAGHIRLLYRGGIGFVVAAGICSMVQEGVDEGVVGGKDCWCLWRVVTQFVHGCCWS